MIRAWLYGLPGSANSACSLNNRLNHIIASEIATDREGVIFLVVQKSRLVTCNNQESTQ